MIIQNVEHNTESNNRVVENIKGDSASNDAINFVSERPEFSIKLTDNSKSLLNFGKESVQDDDRSRALLAIEKHVNSGLKEHLKKLESTQFDPFIPYNCPYYPRPLPQFCFRISEVFLSNNFSERTKLVELVFW